MQITSSTKPLQYTHTHAHLPYIVLLPQLEAHLGLRTTSGECHLTDEIPCPYKPYGCPFMVIVGFSKQT